MVIKKTNFLLVNACKADRLYLAKTFCHLLMSVYFNLI